MAGPKHPSGRPLRTLFSTIWERNGRWVIRAQAHRFRVRAAVLLVCAVALAVAVAWASPVRPFAIPIIALVAFIAAFLYRDPPNAVLNWRASQLLVDGRAVPLARIRAIELATVVDVQRTKYASVVRQLWRLEARLSGQETVMLCTHLDEYALLRAGRRLGAALDVTLIDRCGAEGDLVAWTPGGSSATTSERPRAPVGATETEQEGAPTWSFRVERRSAIALALASGAGIALVLLVVPFDRGPRAWAPAVSLALLVPAFLASVASALDHGRHRVGLRGGHVLVCRPWRPCRRLPRERVAAVRVSSRLVTAPPARPRASASLRATVSYVDLIDPEGRRLARLPASPGDGPWLATRLRAAMAQKSDS